MHIPEVNAFNTDYLNKILQERHHPVDRMLHDELALPYRFDQIKIKPNDDANAVTFNLSMDRLYDNFLYLVSNTKMSPPMDREYYNRLNTGFPVHHTRAGSNHRNWSNAFVNTLNNACIDMIIHSAYSTGEWYTASIQDDKKIRLWTERTNEVFVSSYVDSNKSKHFVEPVSLCRDNTDHVYILDKGKSGSTTQDSDGPVLYRFHMTGLLQNDPVVNSREETKGRELHKYVGGIRAAKVTEKERFLNPKQVISDGDYVYVVDVVQTSDNKEQVVVKKYDTRLNWVANYTLLNIDTRNENMVQTHGYVPQMRDIILYNNKFLVLTGEHLNIYSSEFAFESMHDMSRSHYHFDPTGQHSVKNSDSPMYIKPSHVNPNILYIIREQSIEKIYYTRLDTYIRRYQLYKTFKGNSVVTNWKNIQNLDFYKDTPLLIKYRGDVNIFTHPDMTTIIEQSPGDTIMIGFKQPKQRVYYWIENEMDIRKQLLYDEFESQIYTMGEVHVDPEEHINSFVYNKSITKMLYNLQIYIQNLKGVFAIRGEHIDPETETHYPAQFEGVHYDINNDVINQGYEPTLDNFVHITEPFVTGVFNRCLYELYKLQFELLNVLQVQWVHESNVFELKDILSPPCPGGVKTDDDRAMITDGILCIVPDDDNDKVDICSMYALHGSMQGSITDSKGVCIIYGVKGG